jgi:sugar-specific transcriptional regulator TrmB
MKNLNQEPVVKVLMSIGLSEKDVLTYIFLAKTGPKRSEEIADALKMDIQQIRRSLQNLQDKGLAATTLEHSLRFRALPFEKAIDLLTEAKRIEAQQTEQRAKETLSEWHSLI